MLEERVGWTIKKDGHRGEGGRRYVKAHVIESQRLLFSFRKWYIHLARRKTLNAQIS